MNIEIQNKKIELIQWLSTLDDNSILDKILKLKKEEKSDWWEKLSSEEKLSIEKGIKDAENGNLKPNQEAKNIYGKWL